MNNIRMNLAKSQMWDAVPNLFQKKMTDHVNPNYTLPSSPYGITSQRYVDVENPLIPLPQRNVMQAANRLNDYRYRKLTEKQRVFIDAYLASGFNTTEAAKRAGYCVDVPRDDRYEKACASIGRRVKKSAAIELGINLALEYHSERNKISTDDLLLELRRLAFSNMADYYVNDGDGEPRLQMPESGERDKLAAVSEITVESFDEGRGENKREVKRIKFKMHPKIPAIDKLLEIASVKGDPAVVGLGQGNNGAPTVNVFNIMPVPSGEFIPAPTKPAVSPPPEQYKLTAPLPAPPPQEVPHSTLAMHFTPPVVVPEPIQWGQPEKAQKRSLTIDHEE